MMLLSKVCVFMLFFLRYNFGLPVAKEPMCSKFAYDEQLLEKMIRQEISVELMRNGIEKTQASVFDTLEDIKKTDEIVAKTLETLQKNFTDLAEKTTSGQEKNEEALRNTFEELKYNYTKEREEGENTLSGLQDLLTNKFDELQKNFTQDMKKQTSTVTGMQETMIKTFEILRNNLTKETGDQRTTLVKLLDNMKKPSIAFFAHNVVDLKLDKANKIIVFNTLTTNEGSGYDTATGIFTAPVGGLYQFRVNYCTHAKRHSPLCLVRSGNVIARSSNYDHYDHTCTSFSAVVRVESGEKVWVKCIEGASGYSLYQDSWSMNSFSGVLVNK